MTRRDALTLSMRSCLHLSPVHHLPARNTGLVLGPVLALTLQNLITIPHVVVVPTLRCELFQLIREEM